jgi:hypothetical protein
LGSSPAHSLSGLFIAATFAISGGTFQSYLMHNLCTGKLRIPWRTFSICSAKDHPDTPLKIIRVNLFADLAL